MAYKDADQNREYQKNLMRKRRADRKLAQLRTPAATLPLPESGPPVGVPQPDAPVSSCGDPVAQYERFVRNCLDTAEAALARGGLEAKEAISLMKLAKELWPVLQTMQASRGDRDDSTGKWRELHLPERALTDPATLDLVMQMLELSVEVDGLAEDDDWPDQ